MLDIKQLNTNFHQIALNLKKRGFKLSTDIVRLYRVSLLNQRELEQIASDLNKGISTPESKTRFKELKLLVDSQKQELQNQLSIIPNLISLDTPFGKGDSDNKVIKVVGEPTPQKYDYLKIANKHGLDLPTAVKLSKSRFSVMSGDVAKLQRKLLNNAIDFYEQRGYEFHYLPYLVNEQTMFGTGQFPKFKDDLFKVDDLYLIPTGEVPLTNLFQNKTMRDPNFVFSGMAHTPCFRKEAGSSGKDTTGIIRQHQFEKVELVKVCAAHYAENEFAKLLSDIEQFISSFNIPYRIIQLCSGDIGFSGHRAFDIEVWFPSQNKYREVASITWCSDFQARRMNAKVKINEKSQFVHTMNGTGLAVGRMMAGLIDNYGNDVFAKFLK